MKIRLNRKLIAEKLCPNCLNPLEIMTLPNNWVTPPMYKCEKCGYAGYVALEKDEKK